MVLQKRLAWAFVINPRVLSANRVDLVFCLFHKFSNVTPPPPRRMERVVLDQARSSRRQLAGDVVDRQHERLSEVRALFRQG